MATLPIERGEPGPGLLAHIMVAKFDDHIPLYRLSGMYDRLGIDISRSVMADWVGRVSALLSPLVSLKKPMSLRSTVSIRTIPRSMFSTLGEARQRLAGFGVYVFDCRGYQDPNPGAIAYYYSPDRKGIASGRPSRHLQRRDARRWLWWLQEALRQSDHRGGLYGACAASSMI